MNKDRKRVIKTAYPHNLLNMGDLLNVDICRELFGITIQPAGTMTCEMSAIGSGLDGFLKAPSRIKNFLKSAYSFFSGPVYVWGTGFINSGIGDNRTFFRKDMHFHAVRGNLTKVRVEGIIKRKLNIPTGDGGLLASYLVDTEVSPKCEIGIIPHFREKDEKEFLRLREHYKNAVIIDVEAPPIIVIKKIMECEYILSSSLHGLIVADSFGIPNRHIVLTKKLVGDGFKFRDYYSSFGLEDNPFDLNNGIMPTINQIIDTYKISREEVKKKKEQLISAFPFS